jgi:hypothetical protein
VSDSTDQTDCTSRLCCRFDNWIPYVNKQLRLKTVVYSAENLDEETDTDYPSESDGDVQADLSQSQEVGSKGTLHTSNFNRHLGLPMYLLYLVRFGLLCSSVT